MENLLELTKLKHRHEMERYAAIIGGTIGPFGLLAAAALITWICISRKKKTLEEIIKGKIRKKLIEKK